MARKNILVIDDSDSYFEQLKLFLEREGQYKVIRRYTHAEFADVVFNALPDLVIVSFKKNRLDTLFNASFIKERYKNVKVVISVHANELRFLPVPQLMALGVEGGYIRYGDTNDILITLQAVFDGRFSFPKENL